MMKSFYMIRHGQTEANKLDIAAGSFDSPLTDDGILQAKSAANVISKYASEISYITHSNLSRAKDTANFINKEIGLPIYEISDLSEQNFGEWCGMDWSTMRQKITSGENPPKGETLPQFYKRALNGISISCDTQKGTPLIVSHGGVFDAFFEHYNMPYIDVKNCTLYLFEYIKSDNSIKWEINHHC